MKILVIGSGPIVIGQAAEFDYAGTQACKSLREEGHQVVLINSNPATIMTDPGVADFLYIEPLNVTFCERVIARERPDALLPTLGGQTGLNLATQLSDQGILEKYNVRLLGTPLSAIRKAEDREQFRNLMREIKEPVPESWIVETPEQLEALLDTAPYPCIIRPAYTLGGTGGGIANTREELWEIGQKGLKLSMRSQIMVERSLLGWKEIEYEVMRDSAGNCITVCNMENFDPMGVHTGDSIVICPSQTLSDIEYHMMRTASLKIINALGIEGGCNVQMALNPDGFDYYIIEVNPRVSRSSALASKATGYPIARVAAKIAVGLTLDQIQNQVTKTTKACFEPALDYCVVKIPRWPFDKFGSGDRTLFTQMKATGEVMAIDRTFEAALMKAIRGLEVKQKDLWHEKFSGKAVSAMRSIPVPGMPSGVHERDAPDTHDRDGHATPMADDELRYAIRVPTDERLWAIAEGLRRGWSVDEVHKLSRVDRWFLRKMQDMVSFEHRFRQLAFFSNRDEPFHSLFSLKMSRNLSFAGAESDEGLRVIIRSSPLNSFRWQHAMIELSERGVTVKDMSSLSSVDVETLELAQIARSGPGLEATPAHRVRLAKLVEEACHVGYSVESIRNLLGYNDKLLKSARNLVKSAYDGLEAISDFAADVYEPADVFRSNPYEGGTAQELQDFQKLAQTLRPAVEELLAGLADPRFPRHVPHADNIEALCKLDDFVQSQINSPAFKMVDTCAGEFESKTPYYYATHEAFSDS